MRRASPFALALLAACFSPRPPAGAPCADDQVCPSGLTCIAGACVPPGTVPPDDAARVIDARAIDAVPQPGDRDGDGVPDDVDNCPDTFNPDQGDEDGDRVGDVCDPCPIAADNSDGDGDGVADACDPNPMTPGDAIALFEGFHRGVPAGWQTVGHWTGSGDDVVTVADAAGSVLIAPPSIPPHAMIAAGISLDAVDFGVSADVQIDLPLQVMTKDSIDCNLFQQTDNSRQRFLFDDFSDSVLAEDDTGWSAHHPYELALVRGDSPAFTCIVDDQGSAAVITSDPSMDVTGGSGATGAIGGASMTLRVSWLLVITSP